MYLFDVHTHTAEVSPCGVLTAEETVDVYCELGYDGICVTDHFNARSLERLGRSTWEETVEAFVSGYRLAEAAGREKGLTVLFGAEMKVSDYANNEYLVYGITPEFLAARPRLYERTLAELSALVRAAGGMIFQAHPFRSGMELSPAALLDGIEAYNGNPRHTSVNDAAIATAKKEGYFMLSGSDSHQTGDAGHGGLALYTLPRTIEELLSIIRSNRYALLASPDKM